MADGIERELGGINEKLKSIGKTLDKLPCLDPEKSPLTDIDNLKKDMTLIKRVGGTIVGAFIIAGVAWRKLTNGG